MLNKLHLTQNNNIICAGVLNLLSNLKLEYYGGNTVFENTQSEKYLNWKEHTIWQILEE